MKKIIILASLITTFHAFGSEIVVKSAPVATCYQLANTAVIDAIQIAEAKAIYQSCKNPVLTQLQIKISKTEPCGSVQVLAKYSCN